ncbi:T6SS immunity protein Tdi1 domain-containing protein [Rhizobium helianthi]|uniref:T6SS immunity protein Tdi1 domain-containing protein n=1 Tax=Rhizobium helianthi TaxID=1132695 RepID=A0ABW4M5A6_9HYPH
MNPNNKRIQSSSLRKPIGCPMPEYDISLLKDMLPSELIDIYMNYGRSLFREGLIQTCLPSDMASILALIFGEDQQFNHKEWHAFSYTAFGCIYVWSNKMGVATINLIDGTITSRGAIGKIKPGALIEKQVYVPFTLSDEALDISDKDGSALFRRALKKCGPLEIGECYGFVPALALGGVADIDHVKRMNAAAHFSIVAQTMNFNLIDVQGYGKSVIVRPIG